MRAHASSSSRSSRPAAGQGTIARAHTWITSRLAAPARPTLTVTGSTSALSANALILTGMVALNISVCRCALK